MIDNDFKRLDNESEEEYQFRVCGLKEEKKMTWEEIAAVLNYELGCSHTESRYRKQYAAYLKGYQTREKEIEEMSPEELDEFTLKKIELQKEKVRLSDVRNQFNAHVRREARYEADRELIAMAAETVAKSKSLIAPISSTPRVRLNEKRKAGILCISDVHYGVEFKNFLNEYNPDIARERLGLLTQKVIEYGTKEGITDLYVANLGDMIAGMIHLQIRLESRENVVQQTMHVSELLAEMLHTLSKYFMVRYYDCLDNHSRIDMNKDTSVTMESYAFFIPWYLKTRLKDNRNVEIYDSELDNDMITFSVLGHNVIGVHGHKDKPANVVKELSCLTRRTYDLAIMGHRHHFSADEQQGTVIVSNGSLMGTDDYAKDLRVASYATQNLIIVTEESACECLYRIQLN